MPESRISRFSVEYLLSQSTEKLRKGPFCVSQNFWYRKILWIRGEGGGGGGRGGREGGRITTFRQNFFGLTVPKSFVGEPFSVSVISGIEKIYA